VAIGVVLALAIVIRMGTLLFAPVHRNVGSPPADLAFESIEFQGGSGNRLKGWFLRGQPGQGVIVLMHGVRADRRNMVNRARFLNRDGYSAFLFDFQAHGESEGSSITFGHLEAADARSAVAFVNDLLPGEPVGIIGTSLGGAACVLGPEPLDVEAMVLESVYPDVNDAVKNRLRVRFGAIGQWLSPLLISQLRLRLGIDPEVLRPVDGIKSVRCPVLIISGTEDRRTTLDESMRLYRAAPHPKEFWPVPGAAHVDLHRFAQDEYEERVIAFFRKYLKQQANSALQQR